MKKQPPQDKSQKLATDLVTLVVEFAREHDVTVTGQGVIEPLSPSLVVAYSAYPNGDYCMWFNEKGHYTLIALVNEKREIAVYDKPEDLSKHMRALKRKLGK